MTETGRKAAQPQLSRDHTVGDELLNVTVEKSSASLHAQLEILLDIDADGVLADDLLITPGTQAYIKAPVAKRW
jgi:hypothetical protein